MGNAGRREIRKVAALSLLAIALLLFDAAPSDAGGRHHGHGRFHGGHGRVFIGPSFYWGSPYPYWWYAPPPYYVYTPPPVIVQEPPAYVQATPEPAPPPQGYWYYCPSAGAYYPTAPTCPEAWVKVPPRSE